MRKKKTATGLTNTIRSSLLSNREDIMRQSIKRKRGKVAHEVGLTLEKKVEALCQYHRHDEELSIEIIRNYEKENTKKGQYFVNACDFSFFVGDKFGWIIGGQIEVKNRSNDRINKSALSHGQKDQLIRLEKLGHCGLVLVGLVENEKQNYFLVPIKHWYRGTKKSHNSEDLRIIGYELDTVTAYNDDGHALDCPDILKCLLSIDSEGCYKKLPSKYKENFDNTKLHPKRGQYSTIDQELEDITDI
jgi:hypothetical protein